MRWKWRSLICAKMIAVWNNKGCTRNRLLLSSCRLRCCVVQTTSSGYCVQQATFFIYPPYYYSDKKDGCFTYMKCKSTSSNHRSKQTNKQTTTTVQSPIHSYFVSISISLIQSHARTQTHTKFSHIRACVCRMYVEVDLWGL